jgi:hypothetical protein
MKIVATAYGKYATVKLQGSNDVVVAFRFHDKLGPIVFLDSGKAKEFATEVRGKVLPIRWGCDIDVHYYVTL